MMASGDDLLKTKMKQFKEGLKDKIEKANAELKTVKFNYKTN